MQVKNKRLAQLLVFPPHNNLKQFSKEQSELHNCADTRVPIRLSFTKQPPFLSLKDYGIITGTKKMDD